MSQQNGQKKIKQIQLEAFNPSGDPMPDGEELWSIKEARMYVCEKLNISESTFYRTYHERLDRLVTPYGRNKYTGRLNNYKCKKSDVKRLVYSIVKSTLTKEFE
jgi:hypothetical protein